MCRILSNSNRPCWRCRYRTENVVFRRVFCAWPYFGMGIHVMETKIISLQNFGVTRLYIESWLSVPVKVCRLLFRLGDMWGRNPVPSNTLFFLKTIMQTLATVVKDRKKKLKTNRICLFHKVTVTQERYLNRCLQCQPNSNKNILKNQFTKSLVTVANLLTLTQVRYPYLP